MPGQIYAYRAHGPFAPERGLRFDGDKVLLDPYGLSVAVPGWYDRIAASIRGGNAAVAMKSVVADPSRYDWEGDRPLRRPFAQTVIYELHVRGFTRHPSSGVSADRRGTYAGLIEKIPYLKDLGVTAVELLPVQQFDPQVGAAGRELLGLPAGLVLRAASRRTAPRPDPLGALDEFRDMVKALHRAGIEVILDVVYNHTAEAGEDGPTLCYRGLAQRVLLHPGGRPLEYADYTGCGNTLNANQSIVRRMIQDSLRYWVAEMHVDGFRFDLASILTRDEAGHPLPNPPVLWDIESDPLLAGTKLIAEAWDAAGLYQVGSFIGDTWQEWNGRFRDDVRRFWKGDDGTVQALAMRLLGSPDIYGHEEREAEQSINFVTCHDGFTPERSRLLQPEAQRGERRAQSRRSRRQHQLELRRRRTHRRSGGGSAAQPAGEELARGADARVGNADAADGRRGPADAAGQQQRLLPGRRDQLVRLEPGRTARGHAPVREGACRIQAAPRRGGARHGAQPESTPRTVAAGLARRQARPSRLGRQLALAGVHAPQPPCAFPDSRDAERVLGAARASRFRRWMPPRRPGGGAASTRRPDRLATRRSFVTPRAMRPGTCVVQPRSLVLLASSLPRTAAGASKPVS